MDFLETTNGRICKSFKNDCVVRSISIATEQDYGDVFDDLMKLGSELRAYPNHDKVWQRYLEKTLGWVKNKPPRIEGKLIKLGDWNPDHTAAVIRNSGHLTAMHNGIIKDTWDCRYRPVNSYWTES